MGFIPNEVIQQVLDRSDIVAVVSSYIPLKHAGRNWKATCPFHHEKTPSFVVNPDKQIFHCFGCGVGGNVITFVMQQDHLGFPEAVRLLAEKTGVVIALQDKNDSPAKQLRQQLFKINELAARYFHHNLLSDKSPAAKAARTYLKGRKVSLEMVKNFTLGFALEKWDGLVTHLREQGISLSLMEKAGLIITQNKGSGFYDRFRNRIIFPISDGRANCVAFGARTMQDDNQAKYINSPETGIYTKGKQLYGFHLAKEAVSRQDSVIVVEGYMDFVMPFQAGVHHLVASLGTALTIDQIRLLHRYTHNVVMLFDNDQAGEAAMIRSLDLLVEEGMNVRIASLTDKTDPDSYIRRFGVEEFHKRIQEADSLFDFKLKFLINRFGDKAVEGRANISAEMLPTIHKFKNAILRSEYMKRLAQALSISEDALLSELKKTANQADGHRGTGSPRQVKRFDADGGIRPAERDILKLMLEEKEFIPLTQEEVAPADFQNKLVRHIVEKMYELFGQGRDINCSVLMSCFDDQKILQILSQLMASEDVLAGDKKRIHRDCIQRLQQERLRSQRRHILDQMGLAQETGDQQKLEKLTYDFNQLIKG